MYTRLGDWASRHGAVVLGLWFAATAALWLLAPEWNAVTRDGEAAYLPPQLPSRRGERLLREAFPEQNAPSQLVLVIRHRGRGFSFRRGLSAPQREDLRWVARIEQLAVDLARQRGVLLSHWSPLGGRSTAQRLMAHPLRSRDGKAVLVVLNLSSDFAAVENMTLMQQLQERLQQLHQEPGFPADRLEVGITGTATIGGDTFLAANQSIRNTETTTVVMVLLILLVVYRAPLLTLVPLITIGASVVVATALVSLLALAAQHLSWFHFMIFKTTRIFIVVILFGAGTDFCLFLIARFREELAREGRSVPEAVHQALVQVGRALAASALTTAVGLGMMGFAQFGKFRNSGPALALCLLVTLAASLTLAPALLRLLGPALFWSWGWRSRFSGRFGKNSTPGQSGPESASQQDAGRDAADQQEQSSPGPGIAPEGSSRFWARVADWTLAQPLLTLAVALLLMAPLAWVGWHVPVSFNLLADLGPESPSVRGTQMLQAHFPPGYVGPILVLGVRPQGDWLSREGRRRMEQLDRQLRSLPGVALVRSAAAPLGQLPQGTLSGSELARLRAAGRRYVSQQEGYRGQVARWEVVPQVDPFDRRALDVYRQIQQTLRRLGREPDGASWWTQVRFEAAGTVPTVADLRQTIRADQRLIQVLCVLAVLGVLVVMLRRVGLSVYLVFTVLFSYLVTLGVSWLVFSWWYGQSLEGLDWKVPLFLFVILVAVGEDYNIYLVTRVQEDQQRLGSRHGLRQAMIRTGGIITSCGLIMAATFGSMTLGTLRAIVELGFALSFGVLLDTLVVRSVLVPAFLALEATRQ